VYQIRASVRTVATPRSWGARYPAKRRVAPALALYDEEALRDDPFGRRIFALSYLATGAIVAGRIGEGHRREAEMLALAEARGVASDLAIAMLASFTPHLLRREPAAILERAPKLMALCAKHKLEMIGVYAQSGIAWATACASDSAEGIALVREDALRRRAGNRRMFDVRAFGGLAEVYAGVGSLSEAFASLDDAFAALGEHEVYRPDLLRCRGDLLAQQGDDLDAAEATYHEATLRARAMGALLFELRVATGLARLRRGRDGEAREVLEPVYQRFPEAADCRDGREAKALLDALG
jgi:hypothetical protein